jgi:hypothetical protein
MLHVYIQHSIIVKLHKYTALLSLGVILLSVCLHTLLNVFTFVFSVHTFLLLLTICLVKVHNIQKATIFFSWEIQYNTCFIYFNCPPRKVIISTIYSPITKTLVNCSELRPLRSVFQLDQDCLMKTKWATSHITYHTLTNLSRFAEPDVISAQC